MLVIAAILLAWAPETTLADRFASARDALVKMYPSRLRPGRSYAGFLAALRRRSQKLLALLIEHLRRRMEQTAGECWKIGRWTVFAADSSKLDCPMTLGNEKELGCASKAGSWPQMVLATLVHLGTGLPWAWRLGPACSSERQLVQQMLEDLPLHALLVADAGFTGFAFLQTILACGHQFIIRVGSNVRLIEKLGYAVSEHDGIVYLWPKEMQKCQMAPLVLRRVTVVDGRNRRMVLLCSVLEESLLSDGQVAEIYRRRWGIELFYRTLKQTMGRGKLLSDAPWHAQMEGDWTMLGLWMVGLILPEAKVAQTPKPSVARALKAVREAMGGRIRPGHRTLNTVLRLAVLDNYQRRKGKAARHWPHKKRPAPPGEPLARMAQASEVLEAERIKERRRVA